ncbi:salicylate hydroxylase [Spathaspora passalidarum NRRL Y-27907]|uniref:Salicylate hydroxylase n=1 Tax=Spathaspora passalidarum (strain NRRL Y-27907 / 11-Y1) TaxID=619300 RepID=G3AQ41_SPAPN|nr:salicylate hydroxylase [Spathaspora passalidarum NRRL Y-27907]EGW31388.1 salicylate hydroxylase [Spathaspora passalidarum NRRL Y-27907]
MSIPKHNIPKAPISLTFIVVGAGLGGLSAAIGLRLAGHQVLLLEAAHHLGEVGAGIQIPPPSIKVLNAMGVLKEVEDNAIFPHDLNIRRWETGDVLSQQNLIPYTLDQYQGHYLHVHRADYHKALVNRAQEVGVEIYLGARVEEVDFDSSTVTTSDGRLFSGDIIVGYDGVKSRLRSLILGREDLAYDTGDLAYRALIHVEEMKKYPELSKLWSRPDINFWWGPRMHVVVYFLQGGKTCNIVVLCPDTLPRDVLVQEATKEELLDLFAGWDPTLITMFNLIHSIGKWRLQNSRELKSWTHETGNCIILGDASHATLPYLASGASQAVEDAAILTGLFSRIEDKSQIHDLLELTESLRKWRTTQVVKGSTQCQQIYHMLDGAEQLQRDAKMLTQPPQIGCPNRFADPVFQDFLWGYDAFEEAKRGWEEYKQGRKAKYTYENLYEDARL